MKFAMVQYSNVGYLPTTHNLILGIKEENNKSHWKRKDMSNGNVYIPYGDSMLNLVEGGMAGVRTDFYLEIEL